MSSVDPPPAIDRRAIPLAAVELRWLAADGQAFRRIDWPGAGRVRGSLLFLPGRGDFYEKWLESLEEWHRAGWRVTAIDWRGQAGSGRLGRDDVTGHVEDFADWIADLAGFWQDWATEAVGPRVMIGHSMGGHLALRAVVERVLEPEGLILSAPMLGFAGPNLPPALLHRVAGLMARLGDAKRPAWKGGEKPGALADARAALLTHDRERYADELHWRRARRELAMGPGSWRWVERAYASMRGLAAPGVLERVGLPVLLLAAKHDRLVGWRAIERAAARLPDAELLAFGPEARHEILREVDPVRDAAMVAIERFLDRLSAGR